MKVETLCLNCGVEGLEPFYEALAIPVHSCLMFDDRASALRYPTRDLVLGFCRQCGFISNMLFDPNVQEYTAGYEEQQSFSPRFSEFQTDLCRQLIERYDIRDKDIVEIGCGKGDFLIELCEAGGNRGVGIDPTCDPSRTEGRGDGRVRFIADYYSEAYGKFPCDLLCCRHTLEHIHQTNEFVRLVRSVLGDRRDGLVFFEVPAVERVLREGAFWDIYYEHCSYFSLGSLGRLFRANRFDLLEMARGFDDQYLLLVARPAGTVTEPLWPWEDDLDRIPRDIQQFCETVKDCIGEWRKRFELWKDEGRRVCIWGSGSKCVSFLSALGVSEYVACVVDINPHRQGKYLVSSGQRIVAPEWLHTDPPDVVVVMNAIYETEIARDLAAMGVRSELITV